MPQARWRRPNSAVAWAILIIAIGALASYAVFSAPDAFSDVDLSPERAAADSGRGTAGGSQGGLGPAVGLGTGQTSTGSWYELAFTGPTFPDDPVAHRGGLDEKLVGLINRAQRTVDMAVYDFDLRDVAEAMARAAQRGVRVRLVTDSDTVQKTSDRAVQEALAVLRDAGIPIVEDGRRAIMHHKFVVVDGEWVLTGSWNFTEGDTYRLNNNAIVIQSRALAANYASELEKMFTSHKFGAAKAGGVPNPRISLAGTNLENYFCPRDDCAVQVIRWIGSARQQLHFMAFSFTHDGIGDAMLERARAGVEVTGVFETTGSETSASEFGRMKRAGLDVLQDGNPWTMHHKVVVIDKHVTIFGSFNFSAAADRSNDENLLIVDDPGLADAFEAEYQRVRAIAQKPPLRR